jgi:hypothetical protein
MISAILDSQSCEMVTAPSYRNEMSRIDALEIWETTL